jgi:hypothetical protein
MLNFSLVPMPQAQRELHGEEALLGEFSRAFNP